MLTWMSRTDRYTWRKLTLSSPPSLPASHTVAILHPNYCVLVCTPFNLAPTQDGALTLKSPISRVNLSSGLGPEKEYTARSRGDGGKGEIMGKVGEGERMKRGRDKVG